MIKPRSTYALGLTFLGACLILLLAACKPRASEPNAEASTLEASPSETTSNADLQCTLEGFPCTWDEVPPEVEQASRAMAEEVAQRIGAGEPWLDVAQEVAERDDVAEVLVGEETVSFRLEGGRPEWIFASARLGTIGAMPARPELDFVPSAPTPDPAGSQQGPGKATKRALLLSPYDWQWTIGGESDQLDEIKSTFEGVRDYSLGEIVVRKNSLTNNAGTLGISGGVTLESFMDWDEFDAIHLATHGGKACRRLVAAGSAGVAGAVVDIECQTSLSIGLPWVTENDPLPGKSFTTQTGVSRAWVPIPNADIPRVRSAAGLPPEPASPGAPAYEMEGPFVGVSTDFFRQQYGGGLSEALVFLSACSSGANSDLVTHLSGGGSTVFGWDRDMLLTPASRAAACAWRALLGGATNNLECTTAIRRLLQNGSTSVYKGGASVEGVEAVIADVLTALGASGSPVVSVNGAIMTGGDSASVSSSAVAAAAAGFSAGDLRPHGDLRNRAMEIVRLMQVGSETELSDNGFLTVAGTPGDGVADTLIMEIEVFGIDPTDSPDAMTLSLEVDGVRQSTQHQLIRQQTPDRHRTVPRLPLDQDLVPGATIDLGVLLEYPDGTSRWVYEDMFYGCQTDFNGDFQGTMSGGYTRSFQAGGDGGRSWLRPLGDGRWSFGAENRLESDISLQMVLPSEPTTGATLVVSDSDLYGMPGMGGGIDFDTDDSGAFHLGDVTLHFEQVGDRVACGTLSGSVTSLHQGTMAPRRVSADVDFRFWAEIRR